MAKRLSARRIRKNRQYTYEDAADALGVTVQTVRAWRAQGLSVLTSSTPHIIMGFALKNFIANRTARTRRSLEEDEVFCLGCKVPRKPFGMMADYVAINPERGRLVTLCECCEGRCVRLVSASAIARLSEKMDIAMNGARDA